MSTDEREMRHLRHGRTSDTVGLGIQVSDVEEPETHESVPAATPPVTVTASHPKHPRTDAEKPAPNQQSATTTSFPRPVSRATQSPALRCDQSTQHNIAPAGASLLTLPSQSQEDTNAPPTMTITSPTSTSTEALTTNFMDPLKVQAHEGEGKIAEPTSPSNLLKRRASTSPEKFNLGHFEPLAVRTDLQDPRHVQHAKRSRTERIVEVEYDADGMPRIKEQAISLYLGSGPAKSALRKCLPPVALSSNALRSTQHMLATRLLTGTKFNFNKHKKQFSLLQAFVDNQALCLLLVSYLTIPSLISLYAISKTFHYIFNENATAFILSAMRTLAPRADQIFPWRCYRSLCIKDPVKKQKSQPSSRGADIDKLSELSRDVPSLRWLQMVAWREGVTRDMTIFLATKSLLLPGGALDAIKRMWFILDLPLNAHRLALIRNPIYITNKTIYLAQHFFIKVDMFFTDPGYDVFPANHPNQTKYPNRWALGGAVGCNLREKLTAERSLTPLWRVLRGWTWDESEGYRPMETIDVLRLWARHRAVIPDAAPDEVKGVTVMGYKVGTTPIAGYERLYNPAQDKTLTEEERQRALAAMPKNPYKPRPLMRPEQLLMGEGVRRQLRQHLWWIDMMLWGFVAPNGRNIRVRSEDEFRAIWKSSKPIRATKKPTSSTAPTALDKRKGKAVTEGMEV